MLERREHDLVVLADELAPIAGRDQVDRFGGAADEDDFFGRAGADEALYLFARAFVRVGRACRQLMRRAMHIRVLVRIVMHQPIDNRLRLLRGRGVVEPDQALAVNPLLEDRKVAPDVIDVEQASGKRRGRRGSPRARRQHRRQKIVRRRSSLRAAFLPAERRRTCARSSRRESRHWPEAEAPNRSDRSRARGCRRQQALRESPFEALQRPHSTARESATDEFQHRDTAMRESPRTKARHSMPLRESQSAQRRPLYSTAQEFATDESPRRHTALPESVLPEMVSRRCLLPPLDPASPTSTQANWLGARGS